MHRGDKTAAQTPAKNELVQMKGGGAKISGSVFTSMTKIIRKSPSYGIPPVIVRKDIDPVLRQKIKDVFLNMHEDPAGKAILDGIMVDKFIVPKDADYDTVREMIDWLAKMK